MNAAAAEALFEAERKGVEQLRFVLRDGAAMCAMGVLIAAGLVTETFLGDGQPLWGAWDAARPCPLCGAKEQQSNARFPLDSEGRMVVHLNNDHGLTFSEIARKLGPDSA